MRPILPEPFKLEPLSPVNCTAHHRLELACGTVDIFSQVEDFIFYDAQARPEACITTISYLHAGAAPDRPVMFLWNGGPGSASSMLHLECFGPYLIENDERGKASYGIRVDPQSIVDICDLVYLDPVGVGYSRLHNPEKAGKYFCTDGDARAAAFVITEWLRRRRRWQSPVYLCGESYGTVRACRVLAELGRSPVSESRMVLGIPVAGVILVGLATSMNGAKPGLLEPGLPLAVAALPTMAAVNWHHYLKDSGVSQLDFVGQAWLFAKARLIPALFDGDLCPDEHVSALAKQLAAFSGMSAEYFVRSRLKLKSMNDFMEQVISAKGLRTGYYDASTATPLELPYNPIGESNMPLAVMNGLLAPLLGLDAQRLYYTGNLTVHPGWDFSTEDLGPKTRTHLQCLRDAMEKNPEMRVLTASGLYDLCTLAGNTRYALSQAGLPRERLTEREYFGGHGVYSSADGKQQFLSDVRQLLRRGVLPKSGGRG